jgi:protease-4
MQDAPPPIAVAPVRRTGWLVYSVVVTFFLFLSILGNLVVLTVVLGGGSSEFSRHRATLIEEPFAGDFDARDKIAVVYLTGVISTEVDGYPSEEGMVGFLKDQLQQAVEDERVKAIILRINSPGGEVVAADLLYRAVVEARNSKPIVACMDSVGASGGYYVAVGADHLIATDMTITGSIGVIMQTVTLEGLMDKIGIQAHTFKSGKYKDLLNPTRQPNEDEKDLVQGLIMEVYDKFVEVVATERGLAVESLKTGMADGRILSGKQALAAGLVDELGYFEDAIERALKLSGIRSAKVIRYQMPFTLRNLFRLLGESGRGTLRVEFHPSPLRLQAGRLYFLPAYLFQ